MHPWIWLNEPQHGTAVQALTGIIATVAAIVAAFYAAGAYFASQEQSIHARTQADEARAQTELARQAAEDDRRRMLMDEQNERARQEAIFKEKSAQEDATRATFRTGAYSPGAAEYNFAIRNAGATGATEVTLWDEPGVPLTYQPFIRPGGEFYVVLKMQRVIEEGYEITFRSTFGTLWRVRIFGGGSPYPPESQVTADRPYTPAHMRKD